MEIYDFCLRNENFLKSPIGDLGYEGIGAIREIDFANFEKKSTPKNHKMRFQKKKIFFSMISVLEYL